jgi:NADPH:quinone reductase-like Zn-dependent oxidoreductase
MKAFIVDRYKSKDGVRFGDMPDPELRDEDVMVQVHAASVNPLDPKILGNDLAGSSSGSGPKCEDSSLAIGSMRGQIKIASVHSQNSFR